MPIKPTTALQALSKKPFARNSTAAKVLRFPGPRVGPEIECPEEEFQVGDRVTVEIPIEVTDILVHEDYSFIMGRADNGACVYFDSNAPKGVFAEWPAA